MGLTPNEPVALHSLFLHQHQLGKSTSMALVQQDGTEVMMVDIRDWDFDWQEDYAFEEEITFFPGDQLRLTCTFDNSPENQQIVDGAQLEPRYVEFGEGTLDEMCVNYLFVTRASEEGMQQGFNPPPSIAFLQPEHLEVFRPGDIMPVEFVVNAFKLQEPGTGHMEHGHEATAQDGKHNHRSGHYHLYLDSEDDSADHLTNWDTSTFYRLPEDIAPGEHELRVSLRNDIHQAIGVESRLRFLIVDDVLEAENSAELVDANLWQMQDGESDQWPGFRPEEVVCPDNAWYEEDGALEVQTGFCNYLSVAQPSLADVRAGDTIELTLWHGPLRFDEPAEAHVALSLRGKILWEQFVEIPHPGGIYTVSVPAAVDAPAGSSVLFHLTNHGFNSWTLLSLEVRR